MPEHDSGDDQLRQEFLRQAPHFDLRSTLPRKVSVLVRRRQLLHLIVPVAIVAAVVVAIAVPLTSLRSSPARKPVTPAGVTPTTTIGSASTTAPVSSSTTSTTATAHRTDEVTYQPFTGVEVDPALHVTSQGSGACYQYGGGADGRYYYRCGTTQPCFAGPRGTSAALICPAQADPTTNDVMLWNATSVNATGFVPATSKTPWAMQLSNGTVCSFVAAAWGGLGPFDCQIGSARQPADCRQPQPSPGLWTTTCQDEKTEASPFTSMDVVRVWF